MEETLYYDLKVQEVLAKAYKEHCIGVLHVRITGVGKVLGSLLQVLDEG